MNWLLSSLQYGAIVVVVPELVFVNADIPSIILLVVTKVISSLAAVGISDSDGGGSVGYGCNGR